jgi:hypothetical protein
MVMQKKAWMTSFLGVKTHYRGTILSKNLKINKNTFCIILGANFL